MKKEALHKRFADLQAKKASEEEIFSSLLQDGAKVADIQTLLQEYASENDHEDRQKRTIEIVITIGAILIGVGVFSFIASNWQEMTRGIKVFIILVSMLASYSAGWYLEEKTTLKKSGYGLYLLGSIIYGAGIFLIGQMYHLPAEWPEGFIVWMIGLILFMMIKPFYVLSLLTLGVGLIGSTFFVEQGITFGINRSIFMLEFIVLIGFIVVMTYGMIRHNEWRKKITDRY